MSAFIVKGSSINKIVTWFSQESAKCSYLRDKAIECNVPVEASSLAQAMMELNCDAVNHRYHESNTPSRIEFAPVSCTLPAVYKALQCWLYQCMEGDVPEQPFYKFFDQTVKLWLADEIVCLMHEYNTAAWG